MASQTVKLSDLPAGTPGDGAILPYTDPADTTESPSGTTKRTTRAALLKTFAELVAEAGEASARAALSIGDAVAATADQIGFYGAATVGQGLALADLSSDGTASAAQIAAAINAINNRLRRTGFVNPYNPPQFMTAGLVADYQFRDGSGDVVRDSWTNGYHGTRVGGTGGVKPAWTSTGLDWSAVPIGGLGGVTIPVPPAQAVTIYALCGNTAPADYTSSYRFIIGGDTSSLFNFGTRAKVYPWFATGQTHGETLPLPLVFANGDQSRPYQFTFPGNLEFLTYSGGTNPSPDLMAVGSTVGYSSLGNVYTAATGRTGSLRIGTCGAGSFGWGGPIARILIYNQQHTAAQIAAQDAAAQAWAAGLGLPYPARNPATGNVLVCLGDSITRGQGITMPWPNSMPLTATWSVYNLGITGMRMVEMKNFLVYNAARVYPPNATRKVAVLWGGTNDLDPTGAVVFSDLQITVAALVAQGWKVIIIPMISRTGCDPNKNAYNPLIWGASWGPNVVVMQANNSFVGSGSGFNYFADGACNDVTNYQGDKIHLSQTGANTWGAAIGAMVDALG